MLRGDAGVICYGCTAYVHCASNGRFRPAAGQ